MLRTQSKSTIYSCNVSVSKRHYISDFAYADVCDASISIRTSFSSNAFVILIVEMIRTWYRKIMTF